MAYRRRVVDVELARRIPASEAVVIEGAPGHARQRDARRRAVLLDVDRAARAAASFGQSLVIPGATPRLIDERQIVPEIWNHIRRTIDDRNEVAQRVT